jgi:hypothetical protein
MVNPFSTTTHQTPKIKIKIKIKRKKSQKSKSKSRSKSKAKPSVASLSAKVQVKPGRDSAENRENRAAPGHRPGRKLSTAP